MVAPKEIEQMNRPKHHLETIPICNSFLSITRLAQRSPSAPDFMECLGCNSREMAPVTNILWEISRHVGLSKMSLLDGMAVLEEAKVGGLRTGLLD
ncbi:hypothetical protein QQF64_030321 [Cirrhinus molitorella]|uniref:Uncharacterized protein n=1 Tax=Cirrhinus molitorella TaxID=172907 RepID=A0ABR3N302_9TELE